MTTPVALGLLRAESGDHPPLVGMYRQYRTLHTRNVDLDHVTNNRDTCVQLVTDGGGLARFLYYHRDDGKLFMVARSWHGGDVYRPLDAPLRNEF